MVFSQRGVAVEFSSERGSLIVATLLFMVVFLGIASLAIDVSRYFYKSQQLQSIADNAALAGGRVFNRYEDSAPDNATINNRILSYIKNHQGEEYLDLYPRASADNVEGIIIRPLNPPGGSSTCTEGFAINDGNIVLNRPASVTTDVLGVAMKNGYGDRFPVTSQINVKRTDESDSDVEPWGDYDDPYSGNMNVPGSVPSSTLPPEDAGNTISIRGKAFEVDRSGVQMEAEMGDPTTRTLSNGDDVPDDVEGYGDQADASAFVQQYVDEDGKIDLPQNEALVLFELYTDYKGSDAYDLQDLVVHVTVNPQPYEPGEDSISNVSSSGSSSSACNPYPDGAYRIGVVAYDQLNPYFWPKWLVGSDDGRGFARTAVAEVLPQKVHRNFPDPQCGVYAGKSVSVTGNNLNAGGVNFCSNGDVQAASSNNGVMGDLFVAQGENRVVTVPGGKAGKTIKLPEPRPIPTFADNDPSSFDVNLSDFGTWADLGHCSSDDDEIARALRTKGSGSADVSWGKGGEVCVIKDDSGRYTIDQNNGGLIQRSDGSSVSIYADNDVTFSGNKNGLKGGLYAKGTVDVTGNKYDFLGDHTVKGGLALWSEGSMDFHKNNIELEGITGSWGDYKFRSGGGGQGPVVRGVIATRGEFHMDSNSNNAEFVHDRSTYNQAALSGDWSQQAQAELDQPLYSNVDVRLIN